MRNNPVSQYMTPNPHRVGPTALVAEARDLMQRHRIHHLPVVDDGKLVGILSQHDVDATHQSNAFASLPVQVVMQREVFTVDGQTPLAQVVRQMARQRLHSAVVTADGHMAGIFTAVDGLVALLFLLERTPKDLDTRSDRM
jgi:acetoin utilization protein AcuB